MKRLMLAVGFVPMLVVAVEAAEFRITTEEYPPFNMTQQGVVVGIATDLVRAIFEKAGIRQTIEVLPWNRAYNDAINTPNTCVYSTTETEERKPLFKWVGPIASNNWVLFARSDREIRVEKLEDVKNLTIGGYSGDAAALFLKQGGYKVDEAGRDQLNPAKLVNGRIDLWATGSELGPLLASEQGIKDIKPVFTFRETRMSLACNKNSDPAALEALRAALVEVLAAKHASK